MTEAKQETPVKEEKLAPEAEQGAVPKTKKKRKVKKSVPKGRINIYASFNNTIITVTDPSGGALVSASAGSSGFKGTKKGTAYAAQIATDSAIASAKQQFGLKQADVVIKGIGMGREAAVRTLGNSGLVIESINDRTGAPHGGTRPPRARRV